ncbi:MAG: alpha/beta hydrolase [Candidatus Saccharibacteria bacterium]
MSQIEVTNRKGHCLAASYESQGNPDRLIILVPGLGGNFDEPHLKAAREVFLKAGFAVLSFDPYNTGKSGGRYEDITVSGYLSDLEDVLAWARGQLWFKEPFYLTGHSLGGITVGVYAESNPDRVAGLILLSSVISGKLSCESEFYRNNMEAWQKTGWLIDDIGERLPWSHMRDRLKYDLASVAGRLVMPVLQIVGSDDEHCPFKDQSVLFQAIPGTKKRLMVVPQAEHCFEGKLSQYEKILSEGISVLFP